MTLLLDTSLWIDFTRARSQAALKQFIAPFVLDPGAHLAEPVLFEVLRSARPEEARLLEAQFATLPTLPTPADLWQRSIALGQACRQVGRTVGSLDLLVAAVALHHNAVLVSFDADFEAIASVSELRLQHLRRPA
ncbi:PIN domain-containing protein [Synechococcus sp. Cruz-9H2]|uniref:PIN domain-containing protein n=1 Tax=unclassified Synechococcus TaxID=2626047 RepID=UPI0020CCAB4C|nr:MULTISPECIES: PIN domain-containing protein [unclassified Synechococcus]MCP9819430.1 PIN domain-containing protein [Synechococcus sp. Cruz-9H2]MCP9843224.1 PIN domain-containing protein [Synechococcus sp. Edmonson 11F2]MCP9854969.1 PIN domain-containing protein [Synechococcus sp. Cruz-9C9]MCP9862560.1 PIN domain-containing protein [Synechococcus sp. Cruz-7E5]MCP9870341.1 PIN domain-containing protein [Synechococcus sp. Cruz-7B9]